MSKTKEDNFMSQYITWKNFFSVIITLLLALGALVGWALSSRSSDAEMVEASTRIKQLDKQIKKMGVLTAKDRENIILLRVSSATIKTQVQANGKKLDEIKHSLDRRSHLCPSR